MLASITPLGERGRGSRWAVTVSAFALGATLGGLAAGALAGGLGAVVLPAGGAHARLAVLALALLLAGALDARASTAPGPRRQVNERWLDELRGWVYGLGFGAQLGVGVATVVTSAATYAALLAALLTRSPLTGAAIAGAYGALRGLTPLLAAGVRTPAQLFSLHAALARWARPSRWAGIGLLLGGGALAATLGLQ